jgi:Mn-dependent DtxR family transcriptional regulator
MSDDFHTLRGYDRIDPGEISHAMEDYLEMICRHTGSGEYLRVNRLASLLNVTPPSASKMAARLKESGMVDFEPYGLITLTDKGRELGEYLLRRHEIVSRFFCWVNHTQSELELAEKIEHYLDRRTVENMARLLAQPEAERY